MADVPKRFSGKDFRLDALRAGGVLQHATIFAVVMTGLAMIDWATAEPYWAHWVFLGWGAGLAFHAWLVLRR